MLRLIGDASTTKTTRSRTDVLIEQIVDSAIVAGIAMFSTFAVNPTLDEKVCISAAIAFGLTFLIKLKEYRNIE